MLPYKQKLLKLTLFNKIIPRLVKSIKLSADIFWTAVGLVGAMALIGGSNFYMSYKLDLEEYSRFSFIHMMAIYTSAIVQLSISSSAPRIIAKSRRDEAVVNKLVSTSFYALCVFALVSTLLIEELTNYYNITYWEYVFYISLTSLFLLSLNINGILYGIDQIKSGSKQLVLVAITYLVILNQGVENGGVEYDFLSKGVMGLVVVLSIFSVTKYSFRYCNILEVLRFLKSEDSINYLLPSMAAGIMNGAALVLIYSAYGKSINNTVLLGYAGYIMLLRSVILFLNTTLNKLYFFKFSNEYFEKEGRPIGRRVIALLVKNIVSIMISGLAIIAAYYYFYDEYFSKYEGVQEFVYILFALWLVTEVIYLTLYQKIQVYGLMWSSLTTIALPTVLYAFLVNRLQIVHNLENLLLVYISIMVFSILAVVYLTNKKEREMFFKYEK